MFRKSAGIPGVAVTCGSLCSLRQAEAPHALLQGLLRLLLRAFHGHCRPLCLCAGPVELHFQGLLEPTAAPDFLGGTDRRAASRHPRCRRGFRGASRHPAHGARHAEGQAAADDLPSGQLGSASPRHEIGSPATSTPFPWCSCRLQCLRCGIYSKNPAVSFPSPAGTALCIPSLHHHVLRNIGSGHLGWLSLPSQFEQFCEPHLLEIGDPSPRCAPRGSSC
eukprot:s2305_g3.t1